MRRPCSTRHRRSPRRPCSPSYKRRRSGRRRRDGRQRSSTSRCQRHRKSQGACTCHPRTIRWRRSTWGSRIRTGPYCTCPRRSPFPRMRPAIRGARQTPDGTRRRCPRRRTPRTGRRTTIHSTRRPRNGWSCTARRPRTTPRHLAPRRSPLRHSTRRERSRPSRHTTSNNAPLRRRRRTTRSSSRRLRDTLLPRRTRLARCTRRLRRIRVGRPTWETCIRRGRSSKRPGTTPAPRTRSDPREAHPTPENNDPPRRRRRMPRTGRRNARRSKRRRCRTRTHSPRPCRSWSPGPAVRFPATPRNPPPSSRPRTSCPTAPSRVAGFHCPLRPRRPSPETFARSHTPTLRREPRRQRALPWPTATPTHDASEPRWRGRQSLSSAVRSSATAPKPSVCQIACPRDSPGVDPDSSAT